MKFRTKILFTAGLIVLSACSDLEREIIVNLQEKQVNENYNYTLNRINSVYEGLPSGFNPIGDAMLASATDEAEFTIESSSIQRLNNGNWNAISNPDDQWANLYRAIYKANKFLETSDDVNLDVYRLDPSPTAQNVYVQRLQEIQRWKGEATFLRAYFYFELVKRYGGVPLVLRTYEDGDYEEVKRASFDECIQFIVSECDLAAMRLPASNTYPTAQIGRASKGAALALKSKVLLYAASELFNNPSWAGGYERPDLIASQSGNRAAKWKAAADAAKVVIDLPEYSLANDFSALFRSYTFNEIILARRHGASNDFERLNYPIGYDLGRSGNTPSQNLVDAFEMADGTPFDWSNPTHAADPYANRDPRLLMTVLANNNVFRGRPVELWTGGRDGRGTQRASRTGYYLRKYVDGNLNLLLGQTSVHSWILIRLGEIYLNYAEALNEYDPGNPDIKKYVDLVRGRNGVNMPPLPSDLSQDEMRERIRHERRVELAFEGHRYWDVRRWMIADEVLGAPIRGVEISRVEDDIAEEAVFEYSPVVVENRVWNNRMYLYPIPQSEILQMPEWPQNPNW